MIKLLRVPRLINIQILQSLVFIFFAFLTFQSDMSFIIKLGSFSFILFLMKIEWHNSKNYNQFFHSLYTENSIALITLNITINYFIDFSVSNFYDLVDCGYIYRQHPVLPCYVYARARSKQFTEVRLPLFSPVDLLLWK